MAATPLRAYATEDCLLGEKLTPQIIERAVETLRQDFSPLTDHRGTAWYRMEVASNLLRGFFDDFASQREVKLPARPSGTIMWGGES